MPPRRAHFNGGVNLEDAETVMREISKRVPRGVSRIPDGETGERRMWMTFQRERLLATPGLEEEDPVETLFGPQRKVRLAEGADPASLPWANLGYFDAYRESFVTYTRLRDEGVLPGSVRFQVELPTPFAVVYGWVAPSQRDILRAGYAEALFGELARLLDSVPHDQIAVQWDVAIEFALLDGGFPTTAEETPEVIVEGLIRCADEVPPDVPVGLHLCYGDYPHNHFREPDSLGVQVDVINKVSAGARRPISFVAFTVPQYQKDAAYFAPLAGLEVPLETELYFGIVPYHPKDQEAGTTDEQVQLIDHELRSLRGDDPTWGVSTECGMARAEREEVPELLDIHRRILEQYV